MQGAFATEIELDPDWSLAFDGKGRKTIAVSRPDAAKVVPDALITIAVNEAPCLHFRPQKSITVGN